MLLNRMFATATIQRRDEIKRQQYYETLRLAHSLFPGKRRRQAVFI